MDPRSLLTAFSIHLFVASWSWLDVDENFTFLGVDLLDLNFGHVENCICADPRKLAYIISCAYNYMVCEYASPIVILSKRSLATFELVRRASAVPHHWWASYYSNK